MTDGIVKPRVVRVGAGFGGPWAARSLANKRVDVLVIGMNNYHTDLYVGPAHHRVITFNRKSSIRTIV